MEYDRVIKRKAGVNSQRPDAMSRLQPPGSPGEDVENTFPGDESKL